MNYDCKRKFRFNYTGVGFDKQNFKGTERLMLSIVF